MSSDLSGLDLVVIQIDGLHLADNLLMIGAICVDMSGEKRPLGVVEGATENAAVVQALSAARFTMAGTSTSVFPGTSMPVLAGCCDKPGSQVAGLSARILGLWPVSRAFGASRYHPAGCMGALGKCLVALVLSGAVATAHAEPRDGLTERLELLEQENRRLWKELRELKAQLGEPVEKGTRTAVPPSHSDAASGFIRMNSEYGYAILDPNARIHRKQRLILDRRKDGSLVTGTVHLQGAITAIANYQTSNRADKFGYLMRHPTAANQAGYTVSEAAIHSVQLGVTAMLGDWITGHTEMLFDPEQSFGSGTNTSLERNQVQVRRAYVLLGDLDRSPFHASVGKMDVPFGLSDTVNPFSASTVWHAFGGLANGLRAGYAGENLNVSAMGIQGGAQFRAANTPVNGTAAPSRLNNFAVDANYRFGLGPAGSLLLGGSYQRGTAYCQDFPVVHFEPCSSENPAFALYGRLEHGSLTLKGEFARTTEVWPGTFNPAMPEFPASKVTSFDLGAKIRYDSGRGPMDFSAEFSRFMAGPDGAPWERQDQVVLGAAWFVRPSAILFAEYIRINGYAPLNFISGGSVRDGMNEVIPNRSHSDRLARSEVFLIGTNVAF